MAFKRCNPAAAKNRGREPHSCFARNQDRRRPNLAQVSWNLSLLSQFPGRKGNL